MNSINIAGKKSYPSKIVCIGRNYVEHIKELNNEMPDQAVIFVKPNSAIDSQLVSDNNETIHYEAEISLVIENNQITAVGIGLDLTKRGVQAKLKSKGLPWERAKAFDKSAVFSDFVPFSDAVETLSMQLLINNKLIQHANYDLMIHKPAEILQEVSTFMSFLDGDILMTGTPKGVGVVLAGDVFIGRIYQGETLLIEQQWQAV
ncbi:fumarylacetoacetate hydrolase family protein [Psychromonas sp. Urea-02u-13]|uniref:fumarylacetoacetate hydrolase family protein n=1 Tax=Psychromonas sp. Urea-02u-13 TaxID=2058326 RepID=UPI000C340BED|nr:fumarylacetoacetate hydrolase family protein [Psychromonas sp. Urea-02u-13]PKG40268.1 2-keto-4-pentenoate hydratase [Psychromonas sp. Urea-02u-13]